MSALKERGGIWNLNTVYTSLTGSTAGTDLGAGLVAADKKRFITYIKVYPRTNSDWVQIGSAPSAATCLTGGLIKWGHYATGLYEYPPGGPADRDHPIFTIGGGGYIGAQTVTSNITGLLLMVQYFDE